MTHTLADIVSYNTLVEGDKVTVVFDHVAYLATLIRPCNGTALAIVEFRADNGKTERGAVTDWELYNWNVTREAYNIRQTFPNGEIIGDGILNINGVPTVWYGAEVNAALDNFHAKNPGFKYEAVYA
jgi:hypothetical protein